MIWQDCKGKEEIRPLSGYLFRLVEGQSQIATMDYVDTLEEQALLEKLLEKSKPDYDVHFEKLHYLLKTPFRYPPLDWGSRFGRTNETSLFYGARETETCLAEAAFYRFVFINSMQDVKDYPPIRSEHTLFCVRFSTDKGVYLDQLPFDKYFHDIAHQQDYRKSQALGSAMRADEVAAFQYPSARDAEHRLCVGIFSPIVFGYNKPAIISTWVCQTHSQTVTFKEQARQQVFHFPLEGFLYFGQLPSPA